MDTIKLELTAKQVADLIIELRMALADHSVAVEEVEGWQATEEDRASTLTWLRERMEFCQEMMGKLEVR